MNSSVKIPGVVFVLVLVSVMVFSGVVHAQDVTFTKDLSLIHI